MSIWQEHRESTCWVAMRMSSYSTSMFFVPRIFMSTRRASSRWPRSIRLLGVSGSRMPPVGIASKRQLGTSND